MAHQPIGWGTGLIVHYCEYCDIKRDHGDKILIQQYWKDFEKLFIF